jgi:hypothetical protein
MKTRGHRDILCGLKRRNGKEILAAVLQHRRGSDMEAFEHGWEKK